MYSSLVRVSPTVPSPALQSDSMVEIKFVDSAQKAVTDEHKHRLIYSKSKVYVNPTAYARDNIPGFVALVKRVSR